jgi:hypothetical protein
LTSDSAAQAPIDKVQRFRSIQSRLRLDSADMLAVAALLAIVTAYAIARLWVQPGLGDWDIMTFYLPWFSFLGEQLRHGNIPGWNPHIFSGMPFAGDTQSGWWYAPAMVLFTILPPLFAYKVFIWFHLLLCALSAFVLARLLGLRSLGAFAAGLVYFCLTVGAAFTFQIQMEMAPWLAIALIGVELAARQQRWDRRIAACFLSAFAFSQILGGYLGQGSYYAGLFIGAYIVWRLGVIPLGGLVADWRRRALITLSAGTITFVVGLLIAAAGLLPRFDAVDRAYVGSAAYRSQDFAPDQGADTWFIAGRLFQLRMQKFDYYYGGAIITIAVLGLIFLPRFRHFLFFALAAYAALELPLRPRNIHDLFYHLPEFRDSHLHDPTRVLSILPLCVALFAGLAFDQIKSLARPRYLVGGAAMVGLVWWRILRADRVRADWFLEDITKLSALLLGLALLAYALSRLLKRHPQAVMRAQAATVGVALLAIFIDPAGFVLTKPVAGAADQDNLSGAVNNSASATDPGGAGEFLQEALDDSSEPFRYAGYAAPDGAYWEMHEEFAEPWIQALLGNNRAMRLGLYDIQGYNPSQVVRYQAAITAMNGFEREYHEALIYESGLGSPILDLLNVRYLIVPNDLSAVTDGRVANTPYPPQYVEVWKNDTVTILENQNVLPRAWIVHDVVELDPISALQQINAGTIDPATTATVEQAPPAMSAVPDGASDSVSVTHYSPDRVELEATAASDGLLVLSDVYDPGWTVTVDGKRADLYVVDGVVRGVALPAGTHTVTFDYAPSELRYGLIVSLATIAGMLLFLGYVYRGAKRA